jgi:hypothetical protein
MGGATDGGTETASVAPGVASPTITGAAWEITPRATRELASLVRLAGR